MDKQKQIEEMYNALCYVCEEDYKNLAKGLVEEGCCKIAENEFVLTIDELAQRDEKVKTFTKKKIVKKFAERLKKEAYHGDTWTERLVVNIDDIDEIAKEFTEGK